MERHTQKDARRAFTRLVRALGKSEETWVKTPNGLVAQIGAWELDCNAIYGGCVIEEICNGAGAVTQPFGLIRRPPREFCDTVRFALDLLRLTS